MSNIENTVKKDDDDDELKQEIVLSSSPLMPSGLSLIPSRYEMQTIQQQCEIAYLGGMLPKKFTDNKTKEQAVSAACMTALAGREYGFPTQISWNLIDYIAGQPAMRVKGKMGLVYARCKTARVEILESTDKLCRIQAKRFPDQAWQIFVYTIEDAIKTPEFNRNENYRIRPKKMLRKCVIAEMCDALFPDICAGMYSVEELEGIEEQQIPIDPTPKKISYENAIPVPVVSKTPVINISLDPPKKEETKITDAMIIPEPSKPNNIPISVQSNPIQIEVKKDEPKKDVSSSPKIDLGLAIPPLTNITIDLPKTNPIVPIIEDEQPPEFDDEPEDHPIVVDKIQISNDQAFIEYARNRNWGSSFGRTNSDISGDYSVMKIHKGFQPVIETVMKLHDYLSGKDQWAGYIAFVKNSDPTDELDKVAVDVFNEFCEKYKIEDSVRVKAISEVRIEMGKLFKQLDDLRSKQYDTKKILSIMGLAPAYENWFITYCKRNPL